MSGDVLAVAEHRRGDLRPVNYEMLTAGRDLTEVTGGNLHVAIIGGDTSSYATHLNQPGVNTIHTVDQGKEFNHDVYTRTLETLAEEIMPDYLLTPNSVNGLDYAPALARRLSMPIVTDVTEFGFDGDTLIATREMYGSKVEAEVAIKNRPGLLTLRPGEWAPCDGGEGTAEIRPTDIAITEDTLGTTVNGFEESNEGDIDISDAEFIISVGRGIDEEKNLDLIRELCEVTGATLASSRPLVDNGWLPDNRQVGQSGKRVTPDVYIAIGISGAVQHIAGMKNSETIIAINKDPDAPIFDIADYGVVGDLFDVVPKLIERFD